MSENAYYRPYTSDDEEESEYESESGDSSEAELPQNLFQNFLTAKAGGISLKTEDVRRRFEKQDLPYSYIPNSQTKSKTKDGEEEEEEEEEKDIIIPPPKFTISKNTALVMINSRDRDTSVFLQPTDFFIRLPRTYRNITNIAVTQLKLLSSFYYFSPTKSNTSLSILELGRVRKEKGVEIDNVISTNIRQGTYDALSLVSELNIQLNKTPLFSDISGGKGAFFARFQVTGDFTELFNEPGDNTFNSLTGTFTSGLSKTDIISRYFFQASINQGIQLFTANQALVAFYYPLLKEMILDPLEITKLVLNSTSMLGNINVADSLIATGEQPFDRIVYGFRGLTDIYVTSVVSDLKNQLAMDDYRQRNTFTNFLANKYTCSYDTTIGRFKIVAPSITTSVNSDLNNVFSNFLVKEITSQNKTTTQFTTLQNQVTNQSAAIGDFYNFLHRNVTDSFAIDFGKFTRSFFASPSNELRIFDASGVFGFSTQLSVRIVGNQIDSSQELPDDISGTWLQLSNAQKTITNFSSTIPIDTDGTIDIPSSSEFQVGSLDLPFTVNPLNYASFQFISRCRQNMSFMTLPRSEEQKSIADSSESYVLNDSFFNSNGVCHLDPINVPDFYLYDISQSMFETKESMVENNTYLQYMRQQKPFINQTVLPQDIIVADYRNNIYFQLNTDTYKQEVDISNYMFDVNFSLEVGGTGTFPTDFTVYMYRDRAAFMYDVSNALVPNSILMPRTKNYFDEYDILAGARQLEIKLRVLGSSSYYFLLKTKSTRFGIFTLKPYCILDSPYGKRFPVTNELIFRRMPFENVKAVALNPSVDKYKLPLFSYDISGYTKGYDSNRVSNDYLDYIIRTNDGSGFDPNNNVRYSFRKISTSNPEITSDLWFYQNSQNFIVDLSDNTTYLNSSNIDSFKLKAGTETTFKITNPFIANDITNPEIFIMPREQTDIRYQDKTIPMSPFSITNTLNGSFDYNSIYETGRYIASDSPLYVCDNPSTAIIDVSYNPLPPDFPDDSVYSFGTDASGVTGFTIQVPPDRTANIKEIVLKFAYINPFITTNILQDDILTNGECLDVQYYNSKSTQLRIFYTRDVLNKSHTVIEGLTPLVILNRKRIFQIGNFTPALPGQVASPRSRNPEWGTFYTYESVTGAKPLIPFPPSYTATTFSSILPINSTYTVMPFSINNGPRLEAFYALLFTNIPFKYDNADKNLLVNYQHNYLLTKRESQLSNYQITLVKLNDTTGVSVVAKISYSFNGEIVDPALASDFDITGEFADSQIFLYDNTRARNTEIIMKDKRYGPERIADASLTSASDTSIWGNEKGTIYKARDDDSGFNLLSYIHNIPVRKGNINVLNIRGYVPTSRFTSRLRVIGRNWTHFGTITLQELVGEIDDLVEGPREMGIDSNGNIFNENVRFTGGRFYSRSYALALIKFNNSFKVKQTFGLGLGSANYLGESFDGTSVRNAFKLALSSYTNLFTGIQTDQAIVTNSTSSAISRLQNYVNNRYLGVLPSSFLKRSRLSDPIPFQIQFQSSLFAPFLQSFDEWGLGWNLGFGKRDTTFATQQTAETFIRIVDDFIYLRMNQEIGMNTIDITEKENLNQSQDTFGQSSKYFSKLLLNTFGSFSQTFVQSPKTFNPVLSRLDKLRFQWVDKAGSVIDNNDCEFNITLQITESVDQMEEQSTLITGVNKANEPKIRKK